MTRLRTAAAALSLALLATLGVTSAPASATGEPAPATNAGSCRSAARMLDMAKQFAGVLDDYRGATLERTFMAQMIPHHQGAIRMAELELARGAKPQVKALARKIIKDQREEIATMTQWLRDWYGVTPEQAARQAPARAQELMSAMKQHMDETTTELASVPTGKQFDRVFMQAMIPHHGAAAITASVVPDRATHEELADMAETIVSTQKREIRQMIHWLDAWYDAPPCERR
ncbi:Uncharacterized conserved protein, DUF305 family [Lentzea albidocapillata subsp. violacea]|uniref:Uncharacterized conserved protein, DUF305 family n=1 Tax=Lentzea albidocapillata subsp. violacea TaxID=128104 RepID=A0A1G9ZXQ0_9PSEU|nr:DUF305 domain-containing protein [Lentzea albidocapillata]SDN25947.1 Uncharacterized conserved protein, DUF305 family [Lentzea albidocapillata subsp. violacea]